MATVQGLLPYVPIARALNELSNDAMTHYCVKFINVHTLHQSSFLVANAQLFVSSKLTSNEYADEKATKSWTNVHG